MAAKSFLQIIALFIISMVGGIFADQIFWPYFIERPLLHQYRLEQSPTYVTEKTETTMYVQENTAIRESVEDVLPAVVGVKTKTLLGEVLSGSGLVLTSDGLIVTLADLVPKGSEFSFFIDGKWPAFQILKRDLENNLALIKIERGGLKSRGFADLEKIKLAEPVFLVGTDFAAAASSTTAPQNTVNAGIITAFNDDLIETNIFEKKNISGSPLFDIEGRV
ncbi:MAG: S1C family serine protease, partial [bacterium]|nr:S1C family serine protease [bacterium]